MNNNSSKQVLLSVIGVAILVVAVVGVSFAFFSYVYNGETPNTVKTGTIVFKASDTQMTLTNVFPTSAAYTAHGTDKVNATVSISGETTYETGIEFAVVAKNVFKNSTSVYPTIQITPTEPAGVDVTSTFNGSAETLAKGTVLARGTLDGTKVGEPGEEEVELRDVKILDITAYYDKALYHISDNTKEELVTAGLLDKEYAGTVIPTATWNALTATDGNAFSFTIDVIAVQNDADGLDRLTAAITKAAQ